MAKLRIGPLPDDRPVKRTITFTAALDALIRDYAAAIAAQDGLPDAPPVEKLVPIIVERFIASDRAFRSHPTRTPVVTPSRGQSTGGATSALSGSVPAQLPPGSHARPINSPDKLGSSVHLSGTENRRSE